MCKNLTLVLVGLELMVLAHCEVNNIGANTRAIFNPFVQHARKTNSRQNAGQVCLDFLHSFTFSAM